MRKKTLLVLTLTAVAFIVWNVTATFQAVTAQVVDDVSPRSAPPNSLREPSGPVKELLRLAAGEAFIEAGNRRVSMDVEYFDGVVITVDRVRISADRAYRPRNEVGKPLPAELRLEGNVRLSLQSQPTKP